MAQGDFSRSGSGCWTWQGIQLRLNLVIRNLFNQNSPAPQIHPLLINPHIRCRISDRGICPHLKHFARHQFKLSKAQCLVGQPICQISRLVDDVRVGGVNEFGKQFQLGLPWM